MSSSDEELKQQALEVFGQSLSDEQIEAYKGRLPTMLQNVKLLEKWGKHLAHAHPAQIQRPFGGPMDGEDSNHG